MNMACWLPAGMSARRRSVRAHRAGGGWRRFQGGGEHGGENGGSERVRTGNPLPVLAVDEVSGQPVGRLKVNLPGSTNCL